MSERQRASQAAECTVESSDHYDFDPGAVGGPGSPRPTRSDVAIIGAGFGGLGAAIELTRRGRRDFVVLEQATELGGTWRDNSYPGCACDVPSHLYSYSFAPNPDWSDTFSGQADIWEYLRRCAERYGIGPHLRLGVRVSAARWDAGGQRWRLTTSAGEHVARVLVVATGPLSAPSIPDIPGLDTFAGTVFHSARWDHGHDLDGRRVAVIGTGASAVQFVPAIQPRVERLTLFQRTPAWVLPRTSRPISRVERAVYRRLPAVQRLSRALVYWGRELMAFGFLHPRVNRLGQRMALLHLRRQVPDPALRARLTPTYTMGCKRVLLSNDYLPAVARSNVELVTEKISEIRPDAVVTADGVAHRVDTIILGTGFQVTDVPLAPFVTGRDDRTLAQAWNPTMRAYRGTMIAGFPNLFVLLGPNTGLGHTSVVLMLESQVRHLLDMLDHADRRGAGAIEPTAVAQRDWTALVDRRMRGTVWLSGCASWYLDATGRNSTLWPGYATGFRLRMRRLHPRDYAVPAPPRREFAVGARWRARLNYERRGAGPPLVLIHGIGHRWQAWLPVLDELAQHHEVIAVDLPGFGASPVPPGGMPRSVPALVETLREAFDALGVDHPHVAGNSLGGAVALELAASGDAASATALSPAGFYTAAEGWRAMTVLTLLRAGTYGPEAVLRRVLARPWLRDLTYGALVVDPSRLDLDRMVGDSVCLRGGKGYWPIGLGLRRYAFAGPAPSVPVTVAWGDHDRILRPAQALRARAALPQARHVRLPGCGHVPMSDDPAHVAGTILTTTGALTTVH